jgi:hypothetical protein
MARHGVPETAAPFESLALKTKTPICRDRRFVKMFLVARGGIEPPTQGFSILCSTN